jgi:hypothetical protein
MLLRQRPDGFYAYPEHRHGVSGAVRRILWRLGFDPLTARERLAQVEQERDEYKRWLGNAEKSVGRLRDQLEEAHLARIEAQNPGIDIDAVRRRRRVGR